MFQMFDSNPVLMPPMKSENNSLLVPKVLYENRYCNQDDFSIVICGGRNIVDDDVKIVDDVYELKGTNFKSSKLPCLLEARRNCQTAVVNSDIFAVGGCTNKYKSLFSIEMLRIKILGVANLYEERANFCICCFKQKLYIIGGIWCLY